MTVVRWSGLVKIDQMYGTKGMAGFVLYPEKAYFIFHQVKNNGPGEMEILGRPGIEI